MELVNTSKVNSGSFKDVEVSSDTVAYVKATNPILLAQLCKSNRADGIIHSDPFLTLVPPVSQYTNHYTFATIQHDTDTRHIFTFTHYLVVVIDTNHINNLMLDGQQLITHDKMSEWTTLHHNQIYAGVFNITAGSHQLWHPNGDMTFGAMLYGLSHQESYGMVLGQTFADTTTLHTTLSPSSNKATSHPTTFNTGTTNPTMTSANTLLQLTSHAGGVNDGSMTFTSTTGQFNTANNNQATNINKNKQHTSTHSTLTFNTSSTGASNQLRTVHGKSDTKSTTRDSDGTFTSGGHEDGTSSQHITPITGTTLRSKTQPYVSFPRTSLLLTTLIMHSGTTASVTVAVGGSTTSRQTGSQGSNSQTTKHYDGSLTANTTSQQPTPTNAEGGEKGVTPEQSDSSSAINSHISSSAGPNQAYSTTTHVPITKHDVGLNHTTTIKMAANNVSSVNTVPYTGSIETAWHNTQTVTTEAKSNIKTTSMLDWLVKGTSDVLSDKLQSVDTAGSTTDATMSIVTKVPPTPRAEYNLLKDNPFIVIIPIVIIVGLPVSYCLYQVFKAWIGSCGATRKTKVAPKEVIRPPTPQQHPATPKYKKQMVSFDATTNAAKANK